MMRFGGPLLALGMAVFSAPVNAQSLTGPPAAQAQPTPAAKPAEQAPTAPHPPTADDICRTIEQAAAENELPVEFFARVIWQESRFNARAVSRKGAQGIAQFMPLTADFRGLADPFDPIAALRASASYLRDLREKFGNLGLAAAGYNAGPGRVGAWLEDKRALPSETRNYVAIITGWTADEWASPSPPKTAETTIPQGVPCTKARQPDPGAAAEGAAHRRLRAALGRSAHRQLVGEPGLGDLSRAAEEVCLADRRSRADRAARPDARNGQRGAHYDPHCRRQPGLSGETVRKTYCGRRRLRGAAQ